MTDAQKLTAKNAAATAAALLVMDGMTVGLGTGSTAGRFVDALGARVRNEGLQIVGVATSRGAEAQARAAGIPLAPLTNATRPDLTIDGADEADGALNLIKGGGGALVQEKLVAVASREMVVVADEAKRVAVLGAFPLPIAVVPFGWETTLSRITDAFPVPATLRRDPNGGPILTDDGLFLVDAHFDAIGDPADLEARLKAIIGVAECGLFVHIARRLVVGYADGRAEIITRLDNDKVA